MNVKVEGVADVNRAITKLTEEQRKAVRETVSASSLRIQNNARAAAPKGARKGRPAGTMAKSIKRHSMRRGFASKIGSDDPVARFKELGTKHERAKPFLFPAFEAERSSFESNLTDALRGTTQ